MSLLETLLCLTLVALLAGLSVFGYQTLIIRTQVHSDTQIISTALKFARNQAIGTSNASVHCDSLRCEVSSSQGLRVFELSGRNAVETRLFPHQAEGVFTFTPQGLTAFNNGSVYIHPLEAQEPLRKVVVSQGGRVHSSFQAPDRYTQYETCN